MIIHFHLHYKTVFGEQIGIQFFKDASPKVLKFDTMDGMHWSATFDVKEMGSFYYSYVLMQNDQIILKEWGHERKLMTNVSGQIFIIDKWRQRSNINNAYLSTAFSQCIFGRQSQKPSLQIKEKDISKKSTLTFQLYSSTIQPHLKFGITGSIPELGSWKKPVMMEDIDFPLWRITIPIKNPVSQVEYKFVIVDPTDYSIKVWEDGQNKQCPLYYSGKDATHFIITDNFFEYDQAKWRGSGVAIPVFSLRSKKGAGIGEFNDLRLLTDWSYALGMKFVQVLPVNDTLANKTWQDSYPYAAISVFALHPLYIHVPGIASFKEKKVALEFEAEREALNDLDEVSFEKVLDLKFKYFRILFAQEYPVFISDPEVQAFITANEEWLKPYAAFCHLRDKFNTCNYYQWPGYETFNPDILTELCSPTYQHYNEIEFYYFIQFHADKQLRAARDYARGKGVVLKGDLPIGIYRYSCDAWVAPELYNMNEQAGAPPDDYAELGQNWGFPTYNWEVMSKDNFKWWRRRMQMLSRYFDAMRIDHILGFFRIWQIPTDQVEGTMGSFNPRLPYSRDELSQFGLGGDLSRFTMPYITEDLLNSAFGSDRNQIFDHFFEWNNGRIQFKNSFKNQRNIVDYILQNPAFKNNEKALLQLRSDVLLIPENEQDDNYFNPRITLNTTFSYSQLDHYTKRKFTSLYNDYYFSRHEEYWKKQAMWKLPAILDASDMLICGEDLGMIPKEVPGVMREMNIISLEIQRMPKRDASFGQTKNYPYFSVCSPSCHDMSTIRGWWQHDHDKAKEYYYNYLHRHGLTPFECSPELVQAIIEDHLSSTSMLAIFPLQDLVGMDGELRHPDAFAEQINEPSNPKHYWKFRFHIAIEDLITADHLNSKIRNLIQASGR
jgi:4-alpha-glucanotransferase